MPTLEFWYDFASTYSYLTAMRIEEKAQEAGVELRWRPFLLGPIFQAQGWTTSPFNIYEAKGRHMWRDLERTAHSRGLRFTRPDPFPQNGLTAARLALIGEEEGWVASFTRAVFLVEFAGGADISNDGILSGCLSSLGLDARALLARARTQPVKDRLRARTEAARTRDVFGAPTFLIGDELFWGDDRLDQALDWAKAAA